MGKHRVPAIDGWFTIGNDPVLLGGRCETCGTVVFPKQQLSCPNPSCTNTSFEEVQLSTHGKVWSFTTNYYAPPEPYIGADPFEPYSVAAVELADEKMIVVAQVDGTAAELKVGDEMDLTVATLYEDDDNEYLVFKWRPRGLRSESS